MLDKEVISALYVSSISGENPVEILRRKLSLSSDYLSERIESLVKNSFIEKDKKALTELGRGSIRVVLAGGVFDIIHPGHLHTLRAARALGNVLVVVIATDTTAQKMKKRIPLHNMELRRDLVRSLSLVDYAMVGYKGDIFKTLELENPAIIKLGNNKFPQKKLLV